MRKNSHFKYLHRYYWTLRKNFTAFWKKESFEWFWKNLRIFHKYITFQSSFRFSQWIWAFWFVFSWILKTTTLARVVNQKVEESCKNKRADWIGGAYKLSEFWHGKCIRVTTEISGGHTVTWLPRLKSLCIPPTSSWHSLSYRAWNFFWKLAWIARLNFHDL